MIVPPSRDGLRALVLASTLLVACDDRLPPPLGANATTTSPRPQRGGVLRLATYTDVRSIDPAVAFDEVSHAFEQLLYAKLIEFSPDGAGFVPDLAERWTVSEDGLVTTFFLRRGARFHDGQEVLASDIKRSIERSLHPDTPNPASAFYERIAGYRAYVSRKAPDLAGVKVLGEYQVAIELSEPDATLLSVMALPLMAPVCRSAGARYDRDFSRKACGAGPFVLSSWSPGMRITFSRFDGYYRPELPHLDGVEWSLNVPTFTQRLKFERGDIDMVRELPPADLSRYLAHPSWKGLGGWEPPKSVHAFYMNTEVAPFDNKELRRAVVAAIDRRSIAAVRPVIAQPASRLVPPGVPGYDASEGQRFDYPAALEHMRAAGYPYDPRTGRGGYPHEITFIGVGASFEQEAAEVYQQQLARIGVRIKLRMVAWATYLAESSRRGRTQMGSDGWTMDFPDPSDFFEPILHSRAIADEESQNRAFYRNPRFDDTLDRARKELSWERRRTLYREAEQMVIDDAPWCVVYTKRWFDLWHPYVRGYAPHPTLSQHVGEAWLDRAGKERRASAGVTRSMLAALRPLSR